jgi:hypothetical protein
MSKTVKVFDTWVVKMSKVDNLPFPPNVQVVLDHWTTVGSGIPTFRLNLVARRRLMTTFEL